MHQVVQGSKQAFSQENVCATGQLLCQVQIISNWATHKTTEEILFHLHVQKGGMFLGIGVPILSLFVGKDVASPKD